MLLLSNDPFYIVGAEETVQSENTITYTNTVIGTKFSSTNATNEKYAYWRIPGMVITSNDTVITYYEARSEGTDYDGIDIVAFRSTDGGDTFGEPILLAAGADDGITINNPVMFSGEEGTVHFIYCVNYGVCTVCNDAATSSCAHGAGVFYRKSTDHGATWTEPVNITDSAQPELHDVIATGPGHGIRLSSGTLVVPVWMVLKDKGWSLTAHGGPAGSVQVSTLYSVDDGATWQLGELVPHDKDVCTLPNETAIVETFDGRIMLNVRMNEVGYRALSYSNNGYSGWSELAIDEDLIDPTCFGSMTSYKAQDTTEEDILLFTNCEHKSARVNLTVRGSTDNGDTWKYRKVIATHAVGYSDMAVDSKGTIYILYEVSSGQYCRLARLDYDTLISDGVTALSSLEVEGASDEVSFTGGTSYSIAADAGATVSIQAKPYYGNAAITIGGNSYIPGSVYEHTVVMGGDPLQIVVSHGSESTTYVLNFVPKAPKKSKVLHLNGSSFNDQSVCLNHMTATNVTTVDSGKFDNGAYYFGGNAKLHKVSTNGINPGAEDFTVAAWIHPTTLSSYQHILFWFGSYANGQIFMRTSGTNLQVIAKSPGVAETVLTAKDCIKKGEWQHIAFTRSGTAFTLYIDGCVVATGNSAAVHDFSAGDGLTIGCAQNSSDYRYFSGYMDEFTVFNYALSPRHILDVIEHNEPSSYDCAITDFMIGSISGTINGNEITLTVPSEKDLTALTPSITISDGAVISPESGETQDFTSPVTYTVTSADGNAAIYTVIVEKENNSNLLLDGGFDSEDPDADWFLLGGTIERGVGREGTAGLVKGAASESVNYTDTYLKGQNFTLLPNRYYEFSLYFKGTGTVGNVWYNTGSNSNNNIDVVPLTETRSIAAAEDGWQRYVCVLRTGDTPQLASNYALSLTFASGTIVDDVSFRLLPELTDVSLTKTAVELAPGDTYALQCITSPADAYIGSAAWNSSDTTVATVDGGIITAVGEGTSTISVVCDEKVRTCIVTVTSYANIIKNGDFESGTTAHWKNNANITAGAGKNDGYALKFSGTTEQEAYYGAAFFGKLENNTTYVLSLDYKNEGGGYPELYLNFGSNSSTVNGEDFVQTFKLTDATDEWQTYSVVFTTGTISYTCSQWELSLIRRVNGNVSNGVEGSTYFDNLSVVKTGGVYVSGVGTEGTITLSDGATTGTVLKNVSVGTQITVKVEAADKKQVVAGSLIYTTPDGSVKRILNKSASGFGNGNGKEFTFTTPENATTLRIYAEFIDMEENDYSAGTIGTSLYISNNTATGIRFLNRLYLTDLDVTGNAITLIHNGKQYSVTEFGSLLKRSENNIDLTLESVNSHLTSSGANRMWKSVAYTAGNDMYLVDYTESYIDFTVVMKKGSSISQESFESREYTVCGYIVLDDGTVLYTENMTDSVSTAATRL